MIERCYKEPMMKIYGIDFTSAPSLKKPITYAGCKLIGDHLSLETLGCQPIDTQIGTLEYDNHITLLSGT
jgi:hypothetical protein